MVNTIRTNLILTKVVKLLHELLIKELFINNNTIKMEN